MSSRRHPCSSCLGQRLRQRRQLLGHSQQQLGDVLDVSYQAVQRYESGMTRPSAEQLYLLARFLRVPVEYFFAEEGAAPPAPVDDRQALELAQRIADLPPMARAAAERVLTIVCEASAESRAALEVIAS